MEPDISTRLGKLELHNPIVIASGVFGFGTEFPEISDFDFDGVGAITLKSITLKPSPGNPPPRIAETASGIVNSIGLQNPGVEELLQRILPSLPELPCPIIANLSGSTVEEYRELARLVSSSARISAIEVNISCPNVKKGGVAFGSDPEASREITSAVRSETDLPVLVKLTPNVTDVKPITLSVIEAGADAISLINTLRALVIDPELRKPLLGGKYGGLSGPAIKPVALYHLRQAYLVAREYGIPVLGMGGIGSFLDAVEFFLAGASAVAVGSALFWDHLLCKRIKEGLVHWMKEHGIHSLPQLTGALQEDS